MLRSFVLICAVGCRIKDVDLTGKQCPCPETYVCDPATSTCARGAGDALVGSEPLGSELPLTYRAAVLADAPIGYWRLDDSGAVAKDEVGLHDGAYSGTCTQGVAGALAGDSSTAVKFDGTTCHITLPTELPFPGNAPCSFEAWIEESAAIAMGYHVVLANETRTMSTGGPDTGYALVDHTSGVYFGRSIGGNAPTTAHLSHAIGRFVHLVGVYDGAHFFLYIDAIVGTAINDVRPMTNAVVDATIGSTTDLFFDGVIDEVAVYDHVLAPDRVALHHDVGVNGPR